jgi:hypothetical protein
MFFLTPPSRGYLSLSVATRRSERSGGFVVPFGILAAAARAASGHAAAAPLSSVMNSRRFTRSPHRRARAALRALRGRGPSGLNDDDYDVLADGADPPPAQCLTSRASSPLPPPSRFFGCSRRHAAGLGSVGGVGLWRRGYHCP